MSNIVARIICQTFEWEVNYFTAKEKKYYFGFCFLVRDIQNILILSAIVAPFASAGIRPEVDRLNQDTTVYYGLLLFHYYVILPYKVKRTSKIRGRNTP